MPARQSRVTGTNVRATWGPKADICLASLPLDLQLSILFHTLLSRYRDQFNFKHNKFSSTVRSHYVLGLKSLSFRSLCLAREVLSHFSCVQLFATLQTVVRQGPLSLGLSRQEY